VRSGSEGQFSGNSAQKDRRQHYGDGGVGSVVAHRHGGGESSVVVTTLKITEKN